MEEGTKILEEGAFQNARFDQILLPDTVERIRDNCFRDCDKLLEIRLPASVGWVAETAFVGCNLLERIDMEDGNPYGFFSRDGVLYHKNTLIAYPSGKKDTRVTISEEITALASHAFYGQRYLKELVMEAPTVTLKGSCLGDCLVLERITFAGGDIGFSAEDAGDTVFAKSSFLREVRILGIPSAPMPSALLSSAKSLTDVYFAGTKQQWETLGCDLKETVILHDNYREEK